MDWIVYGLNPLNTHMSSTTLEHYIIKYICSKSTELILILATIFSTYHKNINNMSAQAYRKSVIKSITTLVSAILLTLHTPFGLQTQNFL